MGASAERDVRNLDSAVSAFVQHFESSSVVEIPSAGKRATVNVRSDHLVKHSRFTLPR